MLEPNQPRPKRGPGPSNEVPPLDLLTVVGGSGGCSAQSVAAGEIIFNRVSTLV